MTTLMAMPLVVRAPAKINVHLRVFPVGEDGFHPLRSWFRTIELFDDLTISTAPKLAPGKLVLHSSDPALPADESNLVRRAWALFSDRFKAPDGVRIDLDKHIPLGAGLGGGSSDAALALSLASSLAPYQAARTSSELARLAAVLGADVPFFLRHQLDRINDATCTGRGEIVQPFEPARRHTVLLLLTGIPVSTPAVYRRFDELPAPPDDGSPDFAEWARLDARELLPKLRNDLEPAASSLHPELAGLRAAAEAKLERPVRMTGSGGALFTLYDSPRAANEAEPEHRLRDLPLTPLLA